MSPSIDYSPNIKADHIEEGQGSAEVSYNQFVNVADTLIQMMLKSITTTAPPGSPVTGDRYFVPTGASGVWATHVDEIATWRETQWQYDDTKLGYRAWIEDESKAKWWNGTIWEEVQTGTAVDSLQAYFVGKHGSDTSSGLNNSRALLTFTAAAAKAAALTPSTTNRFVLICQDAGVYTENFALGQYVSVFAPSATLVGEVELTDDCSVTFGRYVSNGSRCIEYDGSDKAHVRFNEILTDNEIGARANGGGVLELSGQYLKVVGGGTGLRADEGHMALNINHIDLADSGDEGIVADNAMLVTGFVGRIDGAGSSRTALRLNDTATIKLTVNEIDADELINDAAGTTVILLAGEVSGTRTDNGTVKITKYENKFIQGHFGVALGAATIASAGVAHPGVLTTVAAGSYGQAGVAIPSDFGSLVSAIIIGYGGGTGASSGTLDVQVEYAADDEPPGQHSAFSTTIPYSMSSNVDQFRSDIASLLTALAAGDHLGVNARRQSGVTTMYMCDLLVEYAPNAS